ncbi:MAG: STAS domain-containing protein [Oscillospiraceae bacterium]|nr:STAS domain-containing protein [Oscillospiraceae bacterium]
MQVKKTKKGTELIAAIEGRIDTTTAPTLDAELKDDLNDIKCLKLDFAQVNYISSAGLRVLLSLHKVMMRQGEMILLNVNQDLMGIFEVTGFVDILNIKNA